MANRLLSEQQLTKIRQHIEDQLHREKALEQNLRHQHDHFRSANAKLFLELLDILDGFDFFLDYLQKNQELSSKGAKRFGRSLKGLQTKLLNILEQRDVTPINLEQSQHSDCYQVIEQEVHENLKENTILKIIRPGFCCGEQILRPAEVITSKNH